MIKRGDYLVCNNSSNTSNTLFRLLFYTISDLRIVIIVFLCRFISLGTPFLVYMLRPTSIQQESPFQFIDPIGPPKQNTVRIFIQFSKELMLGLSFAQSPCQVLPHTCRSVIINMADPLVLPLGYDQHTHSIIP